MTRYFNLMIATSIVGGVFLCQASIGACAQVGDNQPKKSQTPSSMKHGRVSRPAVPVSASKEELQQLKQSIEVQHQQDQERFDMLLRQNQELGQQLKRANEDLSGAEQKLNQLTTDGSSRILKLQEEVAAVRSTQGIAANYIDEQKRLQVQRDQPLALHYRGVSIVPGGFFAAEALYRSHAENADINTSWASIPYDSQSMSHLSEFRMSARQTRLSLKTDSAFGSSNVTGYFETDFLASGFSASEVQTNGYSPRIRQMWARVQFPTKWTFAGGQMWSLLTTNRVGIENLTEFGVPLIDGTGFIGFDYARQNAVRVTKTFDGNKIAAAFAAENAATVGVTPANVPAAISGNLSGLSTTGTGIDSNTTYSTNVAPDLIAKVAFDPKFGHFELKAVGRTFRDRINSTPAVAATKTTPAVPATAGHNNTVLDGGMGGSVYVPVFTKKIGYTAQATWGAVGRYGATGTDVVVKPNGDLSPEKSVHALTGFETHPSPRLDWYAFASEEYLPRNHGYGLKTINNTTCSVETGFSCSANVKALEGVTTGIWYRFYKGPAGTVQYGADYVYEVKNVWSGVGRTPTGIENIIESSFRYYLP